MRGVVVLILLADAGAASRGLDPHNCGPVRVLSPLAGDLRAVAFSPDGRLCAVGGTAGVVRVYETARWSETREITLRERIFALGFGDGGRRLVVAGETAIRQILVEDGTEEGTLAHGAARSLSMSRDGERLIAGFADGTSFGWGPERRQKRPLARESGPVGTVALSLSGGRAALAAQGGGAVRLFETAGWGEERFFAYEAGVSSLGFSRDGRTLLVGDESGGIRVMDAEKDAGSSGLRGHAGAVTSLSLTADELFVLSASSDGTIRLWDWRKGAELSQLKHPGVQALAVHPSGRILASVGTDRQLRVWGYVRGGEARARGKGFCGVSFQKSGGAVVIFSLVPGGPAEAAGLQVGDAVRLIGTKGIKEPSEALEAIGAYGEGEETVFEIERKGEERQVRVRMGKKPGAKEKAP